MGFRDRTSSSSMSSIYWTRGHLELRIHGLLGMYDFECVIDQNYVVSMVHIG